MKRKLFTATLYKHLDHYFMFVEGDNYRFQEQINGFEKDTTKNSMLAKVFGKQKFKVIFETTKNFMGTTRLFEMTDDFISVQGLSEHCDGSIHATGYEEIIWEKKGK